MRVALVTESQHESLIDLLCELHTYYNAGSIPSRQIVREHLLGNLLGAGSPHRLAVASSDEGAGKALMAWVACHAWEHGCRHIATRAEETGHLVDHDPRTNRRPGFIDGPARVGDRPEDRPGVRAHTGACVLSRADALIQ